MSLNAIVVDDEPYARAHLRLMLEGLGVAISGEADHVARALQLVEDSHPDVVFLDVDMPGLSGVQMAKAMSQMDSPPIIVFVTGHSEYAVDAFEYGAADYLVKPVSDDRLATSLARVRARIGQTAPVEMESEPEADEAPAIKPEKHAQILTRLPVRVDYAVKLLRIEEITIAGARDKRVFVQTSDGSECRTYYTLTQLEQMLPPDRFARIHDAYLVNVDSIDELVYLGSHNYEVKMSSGVMLPVGRRRFADLKKRLGLRES
jgi:DNA-binding LytR/AlgR family response regulator